MIKNEYKVIGAMSGTSIDGLDLVYTTITKNGNWSYNIKAHKTVRYPRFWGDRLLNLTKMDEKSLYKTNREYTMLIAGMILSFIERNNISEIDFVSSHGHTAMHKPDQGITIQIGNLPFLATYLNKTVVCDFRTQDVELGGQGAPLVPIGDQLLFADYDYCLNLGGFANLSTSTKSKTRIAFDICPVNIVLNHYAKKIDLEYDKGGQLAASGSTNNELLKKLNKLGYYKHNHPKSLGREWVESEVLPLIDARNLEVNDILRTFVEHCALQISLSLKSGSDSTALITGGGAYNDFLIDTIKSKSDVTFIIPENEIIEYKEALVFGLLGVLRIRNEENCLSSVTGASKNHCSGVIYRP